MLRNSNSLRRTHAAMIVASCVAALLLGASNGVAQECDLQLDFGVGGVTGAQTDSGLVYDAELAIVIAPDLAYVELTNSEIRVRFSPFSSSYPQFAITDFVIKSADEDQITSGQDFMGAGAGRGPIDSATVIVDRADRKTVRLEWCSASVPAGVPNCANTIIKEVTIFPHQRFIQFDNIDTKFQGNSADLASPGGTVDGEHVIYGSADWIRPIVFHDQVTTASGSYYNRYAGNDIWDPSDGGSLNYNGQFIVAVFNPANGRGFGRVAPVVDTEIIKLLLRPGIERGIEMFHYPFNRSHPLFTTYLYAVTGGRDDALSTGRMLADLGNTGPSIDCGDSVEFSALPYTNWQFDAWTGFLSGLTENPTTVSILDDITLGARFSLAASDYAIDFDGANIGDDPADWVDTAARNSLDQDDSLFEVMDSGSDRVFGTSSTEINIHSHYIGDATDVPIGYELSGRMLITDPAGGIGVTLFSEYPTGTSYYRLRRLDGGSFYITAAGTDVTGQTYTDVTPLPGVWYRFRIQAEDAIDRTKIRAMVWQDGSPEPDDWQVEVFDDSPTRRTGGSIGMWSYDSGSKYVDDIAIHRLLPPRSDIVLTVNEIGSGTVAVTPDQLTYTVGDVVTFQATGSAGDIFSGWGAALFGLQNPQQLTIVDDTLVTATFAPPSNYNLSWSTVGQGSVTVDPDQELYLLGDTIEITATPESGWFFSGWTDDLQSSDNPESLLISGDLQLTATFTQIVLSEDFEGIATNDDAPGFLDTAAATSLVEDDSLFAVATVDGTQALSTDSTATNIHSHHVEADTDGILGYEYTGRMRHDDANGGIGVTFFSQFPDEAAYYRLRRYSGTTFHLTATGGPLLGGVTNTGVDSAPGVWYRFRIHVEDKIDQTDLFAKVWAEGDAEPADWQALAYDIGANRLRTGTVGVWSMAQGRKYWDDLEVRPLPMPPSDRELNVSLVGNGSVTVSPDKPLYALGEIVTLEATADPGYLFMGWSGDVSSQSNSIDVPIYGDTQIAATFLLLEFHPLTLWIGGTGDGAIAANPDRSTVTTGEMIRLTATPEPGSFFTGWSGDASGIANPLDLQIFGATTVTANFVAGAYANDFNALSQGENPVDWFDTGVDNSLTQQDVFFEARSVGAESVFGTTTAATNIHSHYVGSGSSSLTGYRYSGRMLMTNSNSGIGVTFLSQFPNELAYYRLRRYSGNSFHLAPVGTSITAGTVDTGVVPDAGLWYRFVIEVEDVGGETQIRAKVWDERFGEPAAFQIDAVDDSATRLTAGTFGVWSHDVGSKYWDDLLIESLALDAAQAVPLLDGPRLAWLIAALVGFGVLALWRGPGSLMKVDG